MTSSTPAPAPVAVVPRAPARPPRPAPPAFCLDTIGVPTCEARGAYTPDLDAPGLCSDNFACDGAGSCKLSSGQPCTNDDECISGTCIADQCF